MDTSVTKVPKVTKAGAKAEPKVDDEEPESSGTHRSGSNEHGEQGEAIGKESLWPSLRTLFGKLSHRKDGTAEQSQTGNTQRMLSGMSNLQEISAKEIMIPRVDVDFLDCDSDRNELEAVLSQSSHSRFPVYRETTDKVIGILYAKDLIPYWIAKREFDVAAICRKPYFIPESMKVDSLLAEFQHRHVHIAIVVDEYGGISGIVCLEDILEEIVGDIQDEFDQETEDIITLEEGVYLCDARLNISNLNEELNLLLPTDDCDTIGGLVFSLLGRIPSRYERVRYRDKNCEIDFVVQKLEGHRVKSVKVVRPEASEKAGAERASS